MKNELEALKKKYNELELQKKLAEGEFEKDTAQMKEQLAECIEQRDSALQQLKSLEASKGTLLAQSEERLLQRERDLEQSLEEKEQEIENLIQEQNAKSEQKLSELKRFYEEEKERLERRLNEEKTRHEKKLN